MPAGPTGWPPLPQGLFPSLEAGGEAGALMALAQGRVGGAATLVAEDEEGQLVGRRGR
jgi:hypothetical protein